jgi:hypothetical protein
MLLLRKGEAVLGSSPAGEPLSFGSMINFSLHLG